MRRATLALVLALFATVLNAQEPSRTTIDSSVLGEARVVLIRTPASYATGARSYPALYLTDGERQLAHTAATVDFLTREGRMPEVILVGITNTDRTRDLTPTHLDQTSFDGQQFRFPTSGGADKFLSFIETELIPYVEANYRTQPFRVFAGHSFGGLFAMHTLLSRPKLFNGIIAVSPTFTWDNSYINRRVTEFLKNNRDLNGTLVVTVGNEGEQLDREMARFRSLMQANAPKSFEWQATRFDDEDHGSVVLPSHYAGLRKIFAPWRFPINPVDDPKQLLPRARDHYAKLSQRAGYTIQIPEPTINLIGYRLMQTGQLPQAIEVFKANVEAYPKSANVYDSLGEAYERSGSLDLALANYERAAVLGKENADPNTNVYEQNRDRVAKALTQRTNVT